MARDTAKHLPKGHGLSRRLHLVSSLLHAERHGQLDARTEKGQAKGTFNVLWDATLSLEPPYRRSGRTVPVRRSAQRSCEWGNGDFPIIPNRSVRSFLTSLF